jgi:hypothetical protein
MTSTAILKEPLGYRLAADDGLHASALTFGELVVHGSVVVAV